MTICSVRGAATWRLAAALTLWTAGAAWAGEPLILADFEDGKPAPFASGTVSDEHPARGAKSLKVEAGKWANASSDAGLARDWSAYDLFKMEAFNPTDKQVKVTIQIRDPMGGRGYWAWHNRYTALSPGANTIQFAIADLWRGEILRHDIAGNLDSKSITMLNISPDGPIFIDHVRLESFPVAKVEVPGLRAFDVGKSGTPGFPGFVQLTEKDSYSKERGFGWTKSDFARMDDRIHPDNIFRDNLSCRDCELAVDVPNGKYRVLMQLEDPGYWEFMQNYSRRTVSAEGKAVIDETMNAVEFKRRYFLNQDAEDFPGEDPFDKYVEKRHPWHSFDVDVADGQLNLSFRSGDTYGNTLSALLIFPAAEAAAGEKFMAYVREMRRFDWSQNWKPVSREMKAPEMTGRMAEDSKRDGFALFAVSPYAGFSCVESPADAAELKALAVTAARGEFEPCAFGMRPARPLGKVELAASDLKGPGGAVIPASSVSVRVGRYRFSRYQGHQSGLYSVEERELRLFNTSSADELRCDNGASRRFWLTVLPPKDAPGGLYEGTVSVKAEKGGSRSVPLRLRVLPLELPEPRLMFTLYGIDALPMPYYPEMKAERPTAVEAVYRDLRNHGINYIGECSASVAWENGKAVLRNEAELAAEFELRKKLGFRPGPVDLPGGASAQELAGPGPIRGAAKQAFIESWHKALTEVFAARGWPHPYFSFGDEPNVPETLKALAAAHASLHQVSPEIWAGIAYHTQSPESYEMLKTIDVQHLKRFCSVEDFRKAKEAGKFLVASNIGRDRFAYGLWSWRASKERGLDAAITYAHTGCHVDIYYGLDAREDDFNMAPPRSDGTLATTANWERIREGIDDFRYAQAIEALAGSGGPKAAEAERILKEASDLAGGPEAGESMEMGSARDPGARAEDWRRKAQELLAR